MEGTLNIFGASLGLGLIVIDIRGARSAATKPEATS